MGHAAPHLIQGDNIIEVTAVNIPPEDKPAEELTRESDNPAGLLLYARVRAPGAVMDFVSDRYWSVITPELDESEAAAGGGQPSAGPQPAGQQQQQEGEQEQQQS